VHKVLNANALYLLKREFDDIIKAMKQYIHFIILFALWSIINQFLVDDIENKFYLFLLIDQLLKDDMMCQILSLIFFDYQSKAIILISLMNLHMTKEKSNYWRNKELMKSFLNY
jgi:hypothetical protein